MNDITRIKEKLAKLLRLGEDNAATHNVRLGKATGRRTISFSGRNAGQAHAEGRRDGANYQVSRPGARQRIA